MKRIHWRKLLRRKVLMMVCIAVLLQLAEHRYYGGITHRLAELSLSAVLDHFLFGVPFLEE
jgi:hypothetical protein